MASVWITPPRVQAEPTFYKCKRAHEWRLFKLKTRFITLISPADMELVDCYAVKHSETMAGHFC
jgi:hypothetical protein